MLARMILTVRVRRSPGQDEGGIHSGLHYVVPVAPQDALLALERALASASAFLRGHHPTRSTRRTEQGLNNSAIVDIIRIRGFR